MTEANRKRAEEVRKRLLDTADALLERALPKEGHALNGALAQLLVQSAVMAFEAATQSASIDPPPDGGRVLRKAPIDPPPDGG